MVANISTSLVIMQIFLLIYIFRAPYTLRRGWKLSYWIKHNLEHLDYHGPGHMVTLWRISKTTAWAILGTVATLCVNVVMDNYTKLLISTNIQIMDPTLVVIIAISNAGCIVYAIQTHYDDLVIRAIWYHYVTGHNTPRPPNIH